MMIKGAFIIFSVLFFGGALADDLETEGVVPVLKNIIAENAELVKSSMHGAIIHGIVTKDGVPAAEYTADFDTLEITKAPPAPGVKVDATFTIEDHDFLRIIRGNLDGEYAYASGKLKVDGNLEVALALHKLLANNRKILEKHGLLRKIHK